MNSRATPFAEMDGWFENFYPSGWMRPFRMEWPSWGESGASFEGRMPKVDVIDRDDEVVVRAEVPGVEKDDLDVSVSENAVTIIGRLLLPEARSMNTATMNVSI